jgi:hypothetical protein
MIDPGRTSARQGRPRETGEVSTGALAFPGVSRGTWGTPLTIIEQRGAERRYRCAPFPLLPHPPGISNSDLKLRLGEGGLDGREQHRTKIFRPITFLIDKLLQQYFRV